MKPNKDLIRWVALGALIALAGPAAADGLDTYLKRDEPQAGWKEVERDATGDVEVIDLELTSQVWQDIVWKHHIFLFRPKELRHPDLAVLVITGGSAKKGRAYGESIARSSGATVAILDQIPNQPLFGNLREDDLIAHSFTEFVKSGDISWPLLFPMTKAAVKAMDAIQACSVVRWNQKIERFIPTGGSKRGWTTWLTGICDERVAGIVPIVFDNLSFDAQMKHQLDTWGAYSEEIAEYTRRGLQAMMATKRGRELTALVDPYAYRDNERFKKLPKLVVNATNDRYWTLDSLNLYWDTLGDLKNVLYVPNDGHGIKDFNRVLEAVTAFVDAVGAKRPLPNVTWRYGARGAATLFQVQAGGSLRELPVEVRLWTARSATKDFRDARWEKQLLTLSPEFSSEVDVERPVQGHTAFFAEIKYKTERGSFTLSTAIKILSVEGAEKKAPRLY